MIFNEKKFKTLVHYICHKYDSGDGIDSDKLNKILWNIDTAYYRVYGFSLTGAVYTKDCSEELLR